MVLFTFKSALTTASVLILLLAAPLPGNAANDEEAISNKNEASSAFSTTSLRSQQPGRQLPSVVGGYTMGDEVAIHGGKKGSGDDDDGGKKGGSGGKKGGDDDDSGKKGSSGKKGGDDDDDDDSHYVPPPKKPSCRLHPDDKPCLAGCGHGKVLNPWKTAAQALRDNDYQPAPCLEYDCVCADSGCQLSWHDGCIAEYMLCQETQICGNINTQPTSISTYNFGACPNYSVVAAPTPECTAKPSTYPPTHPPSPHGDDDDDDGKGGKGGGKGGWQERWPWRR